MAKIFLMCGKICSGKTTYARKLREQNKAVILSADEIMLALFGSDAGDKHEKRRREYGAPPLYSDKSSRSSSIARRSRRETCTWETCRTRAQFCCVMP